MDVELYMVYGVPNQIINENKQFADKLKHLSVVIKQEFDKLKEQPLIIIGSDTNTIWCHRDYSSLTNEEITRPADYLFNDVIMEWQLIDAYLNQAELPIPRYTFSTNTSQSRLDKIYVNENIITKPNKTIHSTFGTLQTDHLAVQIECELPVEPFNENENDMKNLVFYNARDLLKLNKEDKEKLIENIKTEIENKEIDKQPSELQIELLNIIIHDNLANSKASKECLPFGHQSNLLLHNKYHARRLDSKKVKKPVIKLKIKIKSFNTSNQTK